MDRKISTKRMEKELRKVFYMKEIQEELSITRKEVNKAVCSETINMVLKERKEYFPYVVEFKQNLEEMFPEPKHHIMARVKSLVSIFGKMLKKRTLADVFGFNVVVPSVEECYQFKNWLSTNFVEFDFDDRILNPKENGYSDLKIVIKYPIPEKKEVLIEFIIQTTDMFFNSQTKQRHDLAYPWKYKDIVKNLDAEYQMVKF